MGGAMGAGLAQGIAEGMKLGAAQSMQQKEYNSRETILKEEMKKLKNYNTALEQLRIDDPEQYSRVVLGLGPKDRINSALADMLEAALAKKQAGAPAPEAPLPGPVTTPPTTGGPRIISTAPPVAQSPGNLLDMLGFDAGTAGLLDALGGTKFLDTAIAQEKPLSTVRGVAGPDGAPITQITLPSGAVRNIPEATAPVMRTDNVMVGGKPQKKIWYINPYTGAQVGDAQYSDPENWNTMADPAALQAARDAGLSVRPGMTVGQLFELANGTLSGGGAPPMVGRVTGQGGVPNLSSPVGMKTTAEKAAAETAARLTAEQKVKTVPPDVLSKYIDPSGIPPEGSWTEAEWNEAVKNGLFRLRAEPKGGEATQKLGLVVAPVRTALENFQKLYNEDPTVLARSEKYFFNPGGTLGRLERMANVAPDLRQVAEMRELVTDIFGRLNSGGVIANDEAQRFAGVYPPRGGDEKIPGRVAQKIKAITGLLDKLERMGDPENPEVKARMRAAVLESVSQAQGGESTGRTATNPKTGQKIIQRSDGNWYDAATGKPVMGAPKKKRK